MNDIEAQAALTTQPIPNYTALPPPEQEPGRGPSLPSITCVDGGIPQTEPCIGATY